jgi:hypothetical protein
MLTLSHTVLISLLFGAILLSCNNRDNATAGFDDKNVTVENCQEFDFEKSSKLVGLAYITTKDTIVFLSTSAIHTFQRKTHLIPCNESLRKDFFREYDIFLYLKNLNDKPWVEVHGNFITSDTIEELPQFMFHYFSFVDSLEAVTGVSHIH